MYFIRPCFRYWILYLVVACSLLFFAGKDKVAANNLSLPGKTIPVILALQKSGEGVVDSDPKGSLFAVGEVVTITATAQTGWHFIAWSRDLESTENPVQIVMDRDKTVKATFAQIDYQINLVVTGGGAVSTTPEQMTYAYGDRITIYGRPQVGWRFVRWEGDYTGSANPVTITVNNDKTITAVFVKQPVPPIYLPLVMN
ncbi:MAG: hypothetical protein R3C14_01395 [Caldilineaceae bacterium]